VSRAGDMAGIPVPTPEAKVFFLTSPNSPYGVGFPTAWIERFLERFAGLVVADEAMSTSPEESSLPLLSANPRLIIRAHPFQGLFSGRHAERASAFAHGALIRENDEGQGQLQPRQACAGRRMRGIRRRGELQDDTRHDPCTRGWFFRAACRAGFTVLPSHANFIFAVPPTYPADFRPPGYAARGCKRAAAGRDSSCVTSPRPICPTGFRISIGTDAEMEALARAIEEGGDGGQ